jgi:4-hydroxy-tetrahydrodipicolinate reductase
MNIALIGYGKMGKSIEKMATERGHYISSIVDLDSRERLSEIAPNNTNVVIEFSNPSSAFDNISACLRKKVPVISGTTGWLDQLPNIEALCVAHQGTFLTASNFSLGVNIFFRLNEWLSQVMGQFPDYKIDIEETHHLQKLDKPSGTAITLAENIIKTHPHYRRWDLNASKENDMNIASIRQAEVTGKHVINYHSSIDTIAITHEAHSREGFALGAVLVAEWIQNKKGIFTMNDFIKI